MSNKDFNSWNCKTTRAYCAPYSFFKKAVKLWMNATNFTFFITIIIILQIFLTRFFFSIFVDMYYTMEKRTLPQTDLLAMNTSMLYEDLELLENSFDPTFSVVFTSFRFITLILGIIVHRAFYKLMKRLPGRAINKIIYPYMVSNL